ncbi:hypothetical protein FA13DRAFT_682962 [Coprinellus micaceus]|uniref:Uncharacterized protein n=1 Tax=Coprinellus micaceus TaxID=71717 RepID=A0A4Y7T452_COPMI|nr:hypothetical protein FA13DRAFT_682962 [Coprinellus micaceus]
MLPQGKKMNAVYSIIRDSLEYEQNKSFRSILFATSSAGYSKEGGETLTIRHGMEKRDTCQSKGEVGLTVPRRTVPPRHVTSFPRPVTASRPSLGLPPGPIRAFRRV